MGVVQALAIVPGISRSGSTISAGLYSGLNRDAVANFSFLMVLPVLGGAMILEVGEIYESGIEMAAIVSLGVGFFASRSEERRVGKECRCKMYGACTNE